MLKRIICLVLATTLFITVAMLNMQVVKSAGSIYYVSVTGSDISGDGSIANPWGSIQKAANTMVAGDTCIIRGGTYRETIIPLNSGLSGLPITYKIYPGETVTISGADLITSQWTLHSGNIYKTNVGNWSFDQLFVDGVMQLKAQWPNNPSLDLFDKSWMATADTGDYGYLTDSSIPNINWTGGKLWILPGKDWVGFNRGIASYDNTLKKVNFNTPIPSQDYFKPAAGDRYFLFDKLEALDCGGEWFLNKTTHDLYLQTVGGDQPALHVVEGKKRDVIFDLSDKNYINIQGIRFFYGKVRLNNSNYCTVINGSIKYPDYFENAEGYTIADTGILVSGSHNTIDNMYVSYTPGDGIRLKGSDNEVKNSYIHHINWSGGEYSAITYGGTAAEQFKNLGISNNTVYTTGRSGLLGYWTDNTTISGNNIFDIGNICYDLGGIYAPKNAAILGNTSKITGNRIHGINNVGAGIYFDAYSGPTVKFAGQGYELERNMLYDIKWAAFQINGCDASLGSRNLKFYNNSTYNVSNTVVSSADHMGSNWTGMEFKNNIGTTPWIFLAGIDYVDSNNFKSGSPGYVDPAGANFDLLPDSSCIDQGTIIPGYTTGHNGNAPDIGAKESIYSMGVNVVSNPGFENSLTPWYANSCSLTVSNQEKHSGGYSVLASNRTAFWGGVRQNISIQNNKTYNFNAWMKLGSGTSIGRMEVKVTVGGTVYTRSVASATLNSDGWTQISGQYTFKEAGAITDAELVFYTDNTPDFYLDDVSIANTNVVLNPGFENAVSPWYASGCTLLSSDTFKRSGAYSLKATSRANEWSSARQLVNIENGKTYNFSTWIRPAATSGWVSVAVRVTVGGIVYSRQVAGSNAESSRWNQISGQYTFNEAGPVTNAELVIFLYNTDDFYIDDVNVYTPN